MKRQNFLGRIQARRQSALERRREDLGKWQHAGHADKIKRAERDVKALEAKL